MPGRSLTDPTLAIQPALILGDPLRGTMSSFMPLSSMNSRTWTCWAEAQAIQERRSRCFTIAVYRRKVPACGTGVCRRLTVTQSHVELTRPSPHPAPCRFADYLPARCNSSRMRRVPDNERGIRLEPAIMLIATGAIQIERDVRLAEQVGQPGRGAKRQYHGCNRARRETLQGGNITLNP